MQINFQIKTKRKKTSSQDGTENCHLKQDNGKGRVFGPQWALSFMHAEQFPNNPAGNYFIAMTIFRT